MDIYFLQYFSILISTLNIFIGSQTNFNLDLGQRRRLIIIWRLITIKIM